LAAGRDLHRWVKPAFRHYRLPLVGAPKLIGAVYVGRLRPAPIQKSEREFDLIRWIALFAPEKGTAAGWRPRQQPRQLGLAFAERQRPQIPGGYIVRDANGRALTYIYSRDSEAEALQAKVLTKDKARRIAVNIARRPELLGKGERD
jgi:hypothetical protein